MLPVAVLKSHVIIALWGQITMTFQAVFMCGCPRSVLCPAHNHAFYASVNLGITAVADPGDMIS